MAMNITYITMQWPGASETFCARDILALREKGHNVRVLALRPAPSNSNTVLAAQGTGNIESASLTLGRYIKGIVNIAAHPLVFLNLMFRVLCKEKNARNKISLILLMPSFFWAAEEIIKSKIDVLHLFWGHYPSAVAHIIKSRMKEKCPPVTMFLGAYDLGMNLSLSEETAKQSDAVFTHAEANIDALLKTGVPRSKINVVHRGIDIASMRNLSLDDNFSSKKWPRLVFVGRLIKEKGVGKIIDAMKIIVRACPDASLDIIGDGPERKSLEDLAQSHHLNQHIKFCGYLPPSEVYKKLYSSGLLIFPSISGGERLPNAVKEAMYAGVIPIVSRTPGIGELVIHGYNGFILDDLAPEGIGHTVLEILKSQNLPEISLNARKTIADNFDVRVSMSRYIDVWERITTP